ncbi:RNA polymerase sigma factor, sigma-70 family [Catalinimonas alkaloidigena]|uniref:RNA polymerase sigma factor, sigma-70 family n=1 Tax=Catalinimonas alkaloidigena TaxID=1075417 RepID=A0A1G9KIN8_9BACT|nr:sigma-70 family RNA polymerase sigma factor [Catalinimonas alkaloidigena]SDL49710.1 RNA polymerase sigma factor, sigma-70 family [Catalinimonas alkaloidigena]
MLRPLISRRSSTSDAELYAGLLRNDPASFEYLYQRLFPMVRQHLTSHGSTDEDAQDIFQEGVIALWQNARSGSFQLRDGVKLSTYLTQICKFRWMDKQRKAGYRREKHQEDIPDTRQDADPLAQWLDREEQQTFQTVFAQLDERCQEMLQRFYFQKESMLEIAQAYSIGEASAKNQKYRCMQRLRQLFQQAQS